MTSRAVAVALAAVAACSDSRAPADETEAAPPPGGDPARQDRGGVEAPGGDGGGEGDGEGGGEGGNGGPGVEPFPDDWPPGEGEGGSGGAGGEGEGEGEGEGLDPGDCRPGAGECRGDVLWYCLNDGKWAEAQDCAARGQVCADGRCAGCEPGVVECQGNTVVVCADDGRTLDVVRACPLGTRCRGGQCVEACGSGDGKVSYVGCDYFAVDLDNADIDPGGGGVTPADAQFAVVVSNVQDQRAQVRVYASDDGRAEREVLARDVAPGEVATLALPPRSQAGSGKSFKAYRVASDRRIVAYQFNPLNNTEHAYSNDASLLLPVDALGNDHFVVTADGVTWWDFLNPIEFGSFVTIVGVAEGLTAVTVEATADIVPPVGAGIRVAGRTVTATLQRYEVLSVHARPSRDGFVQGTGNLSGSRVRSDRPVAVFAGGVGGAMPLRDPFLCCADHMEEQIFPVAAWGRRHVGARSLVRRPDDPETEFWRITAAEDGTALTWSPARPAGAPERLGAGGSVEFEAVGHFAVEATGPVLLAQFLTSSHWVVPESAEEDFVHAQCDWRDLGGDAWCEEFTGYLSACIRGGAFGEIGECQPLSDPAMVLVPPVEQFRTSYRFLAPADYRLDFINVIAPAGAVAGVRLDDVAIDAADWQDLADPSGGAWVVATVEVADGAHSLVAGEPVGLLVYGYDHDVSYGYPGGLDLDVREDPP